MKIQDHINLSKYKRFFAFGCSFTDYKWPMWPEVISHYIPQYFNYGCAGCDNRTIYLRILEADCLYNFNEDDLIIVMWTQVWRDTTFDPKVNWQLQRINDSKLEFKELNFIFRDFCFFKSIQGFLENKKVDYDFLSICGYSVDLFTQFHSFSHDKTYPVELENLTGLFSTTLSQFKPSMFEAVYKKNWQPKDIPFSFMVDPEGKTIVDNHPIPTMSLNYLQSVYPKNDFSESVNYMQSYQDKISNNTIHERVHPQNNFKSILLKSPLVFPQ